MDKKGIIAVVIILLFAIGFMGFGAYSLIQSKTNTVDFEEWLKNGAEKDVYVEGEVSFSTPAYLEVSHTTNLIPSGKEYYYLVFSEDYSKCVSVRADKDFADQFDTFGYSADGVVIKGKAKRLTSENSSELNSLKTKMAGEGLAINAVSYYIDCKTDMLSWIQVLVGALILVIAILVAVTNKINNTSYAGAPKALSVMIIVAGVAMVALLMYWSALT